MSSAKKKSRRLTPEQREEAARRLLAGETNTAIANDFGVSRQAISLIRQRVFYPEKNRKKLEARLRKRLTVEERVELTRLFETTTPGDHGLLPARSFWTFEHGMELAQNLFDKTPSVRAMTELVGPPSGVRPTRERVLRNDQADPKPQPPQPHHIDQLSPELVDDKEFVDYYLSPICEQIAWREYEVALKEWEERNAGRPSEPEPGEEADEPDAAEMARLRKLASKRQGKPKGPNFTPPKRRKRKKKR